MASSSPSLLASLSKLKALIRNIPSSCPRAPKDGEIHRHFSTYDVPDGESLYFAVDRAWNRVFQGKENVPIGGKYGVGVVYEFFSHFAKQPLGGDSALLELRVSQFIQLVENVIPEKSLETASTGVGTCPNQRSPEMVSLTGSAHKPPLHTSPGSDEESLLLEDDGERSGEDMSGSDYVPSAGGGGGEDGGADPEEGIYTDDEIIEIQPKQVGKSAMTRRQPPPKISKTLSKPIARTRAKISSSHQLKPASSAQKTPSKLATFRRRSTTKSKTGTTSPKAPSRTLKVSDTNKEPGSKRQEKIGEDQTDDPLSGSSGSGTEDDSQPVDIPTGGRKPVKATWAFQQFHPSPGTSRSGKPIWVWRCRWCPVMRTSPRTPQLRDYSKEILPRPKSSNFTSHLRPETCRIPEEALFENFGKQMPTSSEPVLPAVGYVAQRKIMLDFTARGRTNPARKFTKEGFRTAFVKGVIQDGLPFTFGEGQGMKKLFGYSLPEVSLPKRMTVRRDLDTLYMALQSELWAKIKNLTSRPSIAFDIWSSRSSIFAFIGLKVFWISSDWALESHVLDLIHLDDDHSGATSGKHIFLSLKESGVAEKMLGTAADNASSNGVTHRAIAKRRAKAFGISVDPKTTGLGCAGHVIHLSAQDLLASFNIVEPSNVVDHFRESNRQYGLHYSAEADVDLIAQEAEFETENKMAEDLSVARENETEDEESDLDCEDGVGIGPGTGGVQSDAGSAPKARNLNPLEKIHSFVSYVNCSAIRRGTFRKFVEKHCPSDCHRLTLVKGMRVRWNSSYAEYKRAFKLRLAIDAYIAQMTQGKSGQKLAEARKRQSQLYMGFPEWDSVAQLCDVLEVFQIATLDLSRSDLPTLPMVLPLYKQIEAKLEGAIRVAREACLQSLTASISETAYQAALNKLTKYIAAACESPLHLVATALHPAMRLAWFEDRTYWPAGAIAIRVRVLLTEMYTEYAEKYEKEQSAVVRGLSRQMPFPPQHPKSSSLLSTALSSNRARHSHEAELDSYLRGALGCDQWDDLLSWWKINALAFPILSRMARDVLAAPGVSISVERLFSVCRHVMTESRTAMTAKTAAKTICAKEWLHEGLGECIDSFAGLPSKHD